MKKNRRTTSVSFLVANLLFAGLLISSCAPGQMFGPTLTPTPTTTFTPTITLTPTVTSTPTPAVEEIIEAAVQRACQGKAAASPEVGIATDRPPGIRMCPNPDGVGLPQNWRAITLGSLRYVVDVETETTEVESCPYEGGYTLIRQRQSKKIIVYDSITGAVVRQNTLEGLNPRRCPSSFLFDSHKEYLTGESASTDALQHAIIDLLRPLLPKPTLPRTLKHSDTVFSVAFSPDGKLLASGSYDDTVKLWDVASGRAVHTLKGRGGSSVAFSPDGTLLASATDRTVKMSDVASGQEVRTLELHNADAGVYSVVFSPDGKWLASGSEDPAVKIWDVASGQEAHTLEGHTRAVNSVAFSPDGTLLASGSYDDTVKLWDVASGGEVRTLEGYIGSVYSITFSPDGNWLAWGSHDGTMKIWDVASGQEVRTLEGHTGYVECVAFSPDGKWLASASYDTVKIWDVASGQEVRILEGHTGEVNSVAFSPDGTLLASGSYDDTVKLWEVELP